MARGKTARKKASERAKFKRRRMRATGEYAHVFRRKQKVRLKRRK
jgi:hypothetical protein